jgi:hypothetical protein
MTDSYPAELSSSLLARKGMAGVEGFAPPEMDPSRPAWSRSRTVRVAGLLLLAATLGATGTWLATDTRKPGKTDAPASASAEPMVSSPQTPLGEPPSRAERPVEILLTTAAPPELGYDLAPSQTAEVVADSVPAVPESVAGEPPIADSTQTPFRAVALTQSSAPIKPRTSTPSSHLASKPPPVASSRGYRVQLHTLQSRDAVEREWLRLRRRHGDLLSDKQLVVDRLDVAGGLPRYRMQLGNLPTRTSARQLCRALTDRGQKCILVPTS